MPTKPRKLAPQHRDSIRRVRSAEGARRYGVPVGTPLSEAKAKKAGAVTHPRDRAGSASARLHEAEQKLGPKSRAFLNAQKQYGDAARREQADFDRAKTRTPAKRPTATGYGGGNIPARDKIRHAEKMFGTNSPQHKKAIERFGPNPARDRGTRAARSAPHRGLGVHPENLPGSASNKLANAAEKHGKNSAQYKRAREQFGDEAKREVRKWRSRN